MTVGEEPAGARLSVTRMVAGALLPNETHAKCGLSTHTTGCKCEVESRAHGWAAGKEDGTKKGKTKGKTKIGKTKIGKTKAGEEREHEKEVEKEGNTSPTQWSQQSVEAYASLPLALVATD